MSLHFTPVLLGEGWGEVKNETVLLRPVRDRFMFAEERLVSGQSRFMNS